jgi:RNA polymerase primary sigma factor
MPDAQRWIARVRREDPPELWERSLHLARAATLDEVKDQLVALGRERGSLTSADVVEAVTEMPPDQIADALAELARRLATEGIEVIEIPSDDTDAPTDERIEVDLLRAPTNEMVRMYLKEIGKVPLLTAAQEVDLARRIEAGELCTERRSQFLS